MAYDFHLYFTNRTNHQLEIKKAGSSPGYEHLDPHDVDRINHTLLAPGQDTYRIENITCDEGRVAYIDLYVQTIPRSLGLVFRLKWTCLANFVAECSNTTDQGLRVEGYDWYEDRDYTYCCFYNFFESSPESVGE